MRSEYRVTYGLIYATGHGRQSRETVTWIAARFTRFVHYLVWNTLPHHARTQDHQARRAVANTNLLQIIRMVHCCDADVHRLPRRHHAVSPLRLLPHAAPANAPGGLAFSRGTSLNPTRTSLPCAKAGLATPDVGSSAQLFHCGAASVRQRISREG